MTNASVQLGKLNFPSCTEDQQKGLEMENFVNIDKFNYNKIQLNIMYAFPESKGETSFTVSDLERKVIADFSDSSNETIQFIFDFNAMERGIVRVKAYFKPEQLEAWQNDYLAQYICYRNSRGYHDFFFGYDERTQTLTLTKIKRLELFSEIEDIRELVLGMLIAIKNFRFRDVISDKEHSDEKYCDEGYGEKVLL